MYSQRRHQASIRMQVASPGKADRTLLINSGGPGSRPFGVSLLLLLATVVNGLGIRFVPLGLPSGVTKYGGSTLWALAIYWIFSTGLPYWRLPTVVACAGSMATAIEFAKLFHSSWLDDFRLTLPGILLLGRFFSFTDIGAYWVAIIIGACLDRRIRLRLDTMRTTNTEPCE